MADAPAFDVMQFMQGTSPPRGHSPSPWTAPVTANPNPNPNSTATVTANSHPTPNSTSTSTSTPASLPFRRGTQSPRPVQIEDVADEPLPYPETMALPKPSPPGREHFGPSPPPLSPRPGAAITMNGRIDVSPRLPPRNGAASPTYPVYEARRPYSPQHTLGEPNHRPATPQSYGQQPSVFIAPRNSPRQGKESPLPVTLPEQQVPLTSHVPYVRPTVDVPVYQSPPPQHQAQPYQHQAPPYQHQAQPYQPPMYQQQQQQQQEHLRMHQPPQQHPQPPQPPQQHQAPPQTLPYRVSSKSPPQDPLAHETKYGAYIEQPPMAQPPMTQPHYSEYVKQQQDWNAPQATVITYEPPTTGRRPYDSPQGRAHHGPQYYIEEDPSQVDAHSRESRRKEKSKDKDRGKEKDQVKDKHRRDTSSNREKHGHSRNHSSSRGHGRNLSVEGASSAARERSRERSRDRTPERKQKRISLLGALVRSSSRDRRPRDSSQNRSRSPALHAPNRHRRDSSLGPDAIVDEPTVSTGAGASLTVEDALHHPLRRNRAGSVGSNSGHGGGAAPPAGGRHHRRGSSVSQAPPSPILESYRGTYQEASPMPSPNAMPDVRHAQNDNDDIPELSLDNQDSVDKKNATSSGALTVIPSTSPTEAKKAQRRARFYDPEEAAMQIANALSVSPTHPHPDLKVLVQFLPSLTHDQVMELRHEYKDIVKTGPERKGVNMAKHIKVRLKDTDWNLMKACYTVALGKWESEAYWANTWYQRDKTRRELLLEALMGRSNDEIRAIKDAFHDRRYDNDLVHCMKEELKEDKFKKAVLMVLQEERQEEFDQFGRPVPLDPDLILSDALRLHDALSSRSESKMLSIVIRRSDAHLREVLQTYQKRFGENFPREALRQCGNLVGEILAHVLNGIVNKPVRDAILLNHALTSIDPEPRPSKRGRSADSDDGDDGVLRKELLTSRLVRYHWDPRHMEAIKRAYLERYHKPLQDAVAEATRNQKVKGRGPQIKYGDTYESGEAVWGQFLEELCIARTPDDIKHVEIVDIH